MSAHPSHIEYTHNSYLDELSVAKERIYQNSIKMLKRGIWLYFILLIFEGALRKWFLPGLSTPLLIIRDPLALWLVLSAWQRGLLPSNVYITSTAIIGIVSFMAAGLLGHGNAFVALYGARILLIHFPLMFVIGRIFNKEDVEELGKAVLWISIPMAVLIAVQFYSPQSAWVNRGVGGDMEGAGFGGALGYFRPPGTFSFTNGNALFFSFAATFIFYFWIVRSSISSFILLAATAALLVAIPLSISRTLFFQASLSLLFTMIAISSKKEYLTKMIAATIIGAISLFILSNISFFQTATEAFTSRFESANKTEGGLEGVFIDRFLGGMIGALTKSTDQPFFGEGIGMGTNVGSMLLVGKAKFLIAEGEWGRTIGELGPLLGIGLVFIRVAFITKIGIACYKGISEGNILPWILLSFGLFTIMQVQWAQPTSLGFSTLIGGLLIASLRIPDIDKQAMGK